MGVVDSVINGALGMIGQGAQMAFETNQAQKERDWNETMMNKQNEWNLNMWNMTNEYNSPAAQRARLEEAGLNPLYFGLDGSSANGMESAQALGYQRASMQGMENPIQAGLNAALANAQIENIRAQTAKTNNENETETQRRENMKMELDKTQQEIQSIIANSQLTDTQRIAIQQTLHLLEKEKQANINYVESQTKLNDSTRNRIDQLLPNEKALQKMQLMDFIKNWEHIDAEIKKMAAETNLLYEDLANYALNHYTNGVFGSGVSLQNLVRAYINLDQQLNLEGNMPDIVEDLKKK